MIFISNKIWTVLICDFYFTPTIELLCLLIVQKPYTQNQHTTIFSFSLLNNITWGFLNIFIILVKYISNWYKYLFYLHVRIYNLHHNEKQTLSAHTQARKRIISNDNIHDVRIWLVFILPCFISDLREMEIFMIVFKMLVVHEFLMTMLRSW